VNDHKGDDYPRYYQFLNTEELWRVDSPEARPLWRRHARDDWRESNSRTEVTLLDDQGDVIHRYYGDVS
jgi:hypothetical protein